MNKTNRNMIVGVVLLIVGISMFLLTNDQLEI